MRVILTRPTDDYPTQEWSQLTVVPETQEEYRKLEFLMAQKAVGINFEYEGFRYQINRTKIDPAGRTTEV